MIEHPANSCGGVFVADDAFRVESEVAEVEAVRGVVVQEERDGDGLIVEVEDVL